MTNFEALLILFAVQHFRHAGKPPDGDFYGPRYFTNPTRNFLIGLRTENRRVSLRLIRQLNCAACSAALSEDSTGDHIIPLALGGPNGAQNYLPLCGACNSRKGTKDLMKWWHAEGRSAAEFHPDVICAYSRLMFQWLGHKLSLKADSHLETAARELLQSLPTSNHASCLLLRVAQEREHEIEIAMGPATVNPRGATVGVTQ
jgi:HNH endonuclease